MTADDRHGETTPGPVRAGRAGVVVAVALGLALAAVAGTALVVSSGGEARGVGGGGGSAEVDQNPDLVEVEPRPDRSEGERDPLDGDGPAPPTDLDPCQAQPEMCGAGVGTGGACDDPAMCGAIAPAPGEQEIDAADGPCEGELCGEIGPGFDDGTEA